MSVLTRSLFRSRRPARKPAARIPAPRKTRLELSPLDDRLLPSVTSALSAGSLAITGDAANDEVVLMDATTIQMIPGPGGFLTPVSVPSVSVQARTSPLASFTGVANVPKSQINGVTFYGGAGNDTFNATLLTGVAATNVNGGPGDDTLMGTWGNDVFYGSTGNDRYLGFFGNDQLHRNGYRGYLADNGIGADVTTGLVSGKMSYGELTAPGSQLFARPNPLNSKKIQLYGPSGAGFELRSDTGWTITDRSATQRTEYKANGSVVYLETGHGYDLPLPAAAFQAFQIGYSTGGATTKAGPVLSALSVSLGNALGTALGDVQAKTGMDFTIPGLSGGIGLGRNLDSLGLPVAPAVPYLYALLGTTPTVSVGGVSASTSGGASGWGVSIAVDPTDSGAMVKLTTPVAELGFGWSQDGEIPYIPTLTPDDRSNPQIAGNLYLHASGELPDIPVSLTGDLIMDLDANDDGAWCGLTPQTIGKMARGELGLGALVGAVNDIKFGFNGEVDASLELSDSLSLSLPMGRGSVYWTPPQAGRPGEIAFRAASANPFEGTAFAGFFAGSGFDFQGRFNTNGDFRLAAQSTGISVDLNIGSLSLGSVHQSFGVEFEKAGSVVSLGANYHFDLTIGDMSFLGASVSIDANLHFAVNTSSGAISVSGGGSVAAELCLFGVDMGTTFGVSFDNHGVHVDMPGGDALDFDIAW